MNEPERAARKMDLDDNYDDEEVDDKRSLAIAGPVNAPTSTSADIKTSTPTSAGMNGMLGSAKEGA
jgi:general transcriptional corepressor CYC8